MASSFPSIRIEGGLLGPELLDQVVAGTVPGQKPVDFGFEAKRNLTGEIAQASNWSFMESTWRISNRFIDPSRAAGVLEPPITPGNPEFQLAYAQFPTSNPNSGLTIPPVTLFCALPPEDVPVWRPVHALRRALDPQSNRG
jgi:hypothetical protein